jgi:hypothetical protein
VVYCHACAEACTLCADACLADPAIEPLRQCIRRALDCADICSTLATIASRRSGDNLSVIRSMLESCALACHVCAEQCAGHGERHDACRICAEACRDCEDICRIALSMMN